MCVGLMVVGFWWGGVCVGLVVCGLLIFCFCFFFFFDFRGGVHVGLMVLAVLALCDGDISWCFCGIVIMVPLQSGSTELALSVSIPRRVALAIMAAQWGLLMKQPSPSKLIGPCSIPDARSTSSS